MKLNAFDMFIALATATQSNINKLSNNSQTNTISPSKLLQSLDLMSSTNKFTVIKNYCKYEQFHHI